MLEQNHFKKYFLYAIGEIILIVIGILIALSANNYNERKKAYKQSKVFLQDMLDDLASDTLLLNRTLNVLSKQLKIEEWLYTKGTFTQEDMDSVKLAMNNVNWTFLINDRSFQNIQNSNDSKLLGYEELYGQISTHYILTKERILQNNQLVVEKMSRQSDFEKLVQKSLLITSMHYQDYSGFQVGIDLQQTPKGEDFKSVLVSLNSIQTQNEMNDKYAFHNFIYLTLFLCNKESKKLIHSILDKLKK